MLSNSGKLWLGVYLLNTTVFLFSLFMHHYCAHTGHWSAEAWLGVCVSSSLLKLLLTMIGIMGFVEKKFLKAEQYERA